ncbi:MAG: DUF805 domain-containing protein [Actinobacteria bacterium]|nr:DUF805 domain-containing protein [Actinomycetota bacterium]
MARVRLDNKFGVIMFQAIIEFYSKYAYFQGRTSLRFYRIAVSYNTIVVVLLFLTGPAIFREQLFRSWGDFTTFLLLPGFWFLFHLCPILAIQARRMHDLGQSGMIFLVPGSGFAMFWKKGQEVENQYGPPPSQ